MSDWKARMPKERPPAGKAFVIVALKLANGSRAEHVLLMDDDLALQLMGQSIASDVAPTKVRDNGSRLLPDEREEAEDGR